MQEKLIEMTSSLGVQDSVMLLGPHENVLDFYWASDIFVLASRTEGMPTSLLEAMSCGLYVIASRVGGAPDIVEDGVNGVLLES